MTKNDGMNAEQRKRAKNKERRDAEKRKKKEENKKKVGQVKTPDKKEKKKVETETKPKKPSGPVIRQAKDVWHQLELERAGITVNADGTYEDPEKVTGEVKSTKKKRTKVAVQNRRSHRKGHGRMGRVCVEKADGEKVRTRRNEAERLVKAGGRYIAKWEFKDEWGHKKGDAA